MHGMDPTLTGVTKHFSISGAAYQGGPPGYWSRKWQEFKTGVANDWMIAKMTLGWATGIGADHRIFMNDRIANSLRDSPGVNYLRDQFYKNGLTKYNYSFEIVRKSLAESAYFQGAWDAGFDPVKQFIGSYNVQVVPDYNNGILQFIINNSTTLRSAAYHITPSSWNISPGHPMGNFYQTYIFTEPLRK